MQGRRVQSQAQIAEKVPYREALAGADILALGAQLPQANRRSQDAVARQCASLSRRKRCFAPFPRRSAQRGAFGGTCSAAHRVSLRHSHPCTRRPRQSCSLATTRRWRHCAASWTPAAPAIPPPSAHTSSSREQAATRCCPHCAPQRAGAYISALAATARRWPPSLAGGSEQIRCRARWTSSPPITRTALSRCRCLACPTTPSSCWSADKELAGTRTAPSSAAST